MVIYSECFDQQRHVKFVSYTGKYPNLCCGVLTLLIDGKEVKMTVKKGQKVIWETDGNYDRFWESGGGIKPGYSGTYHREWDIIVDDLPEKYREYASEIDEEFNSNVEYGCCGGCI